MKQLTTLALAIILALTLTACGGGNTNPPATNTPSGNDSANTPATAPSGHETTPGKPSANEMTIIGVWEDSIATKQRTQGVSSEEFSHFSDEERERYFEEFGTSPGITLTFKNDATFSGNIWSDAADGIYEFNSDGTYELIFTDRDTTWTAAADGDLMIISADNVPELRRVQ